jgi:osmoprotectant transport system ATP-binding protein
MNGYHVKMINLSNVTKSFAGSHVIENITSRFEKERVHILLGSSGCGKSTLLRLIMGLTAPDTGTISIEDAEMNPTTQRNLVQKMGYVIQDGGLFPHLTVSENVCLMAKTLNWPADKIRKRLVDLLSLVEFDPLLLWRYPKELSGGQKQRVGLMRALMLDPPILLMDEPFGALDPIVRASLQRQLKEIFNRGLKKTVILVTHDISEAVYLGDTITLVANGRILQRGTFKELVMNPKDPFVTEFINAQKPPEEMRLLL